MPIQIFFHNLRSKPVVDLEVAKTHSRPYVLDALKMPAASAIATRASVT
ncbi:MAG: hypothetical protein KGZ88_21765 [Methylomicrobium sp.]|nr:hypothetical protein [Methylomicrobium sp.]